MDIFFQKWQNLPERCRMCWIESKIIFQIFPIFIFRIMVIFVLKMVNFRLLFSITRKIKNRKIWNMILLSFQHIVHFSYKFGHFWGGGGICISLVGKHPWNVSEKNLIKIRAKNMFSLQHLQFFLALGNRIGRAGNFPREIWYDAPAS